MQKKSDTSSLNASLFHAERKQEMDDLKQVLNLEDVANIVRSYNHAIIKEDIDLVLSTLNIARKFPAEITDSTLRKKIQDIPRSMIHSLHNQSKVTDLPGVGYSIDITIPRAEMSSVKSLHSGHDAIPSKQVEHKLILTYEEINELLNLIKSAQYVPVSSNSLFKNDSATPSTEILLNKGFPHTFNNKPGKQYVCFKHNGDFKNAVASLAKEEELKDSYRVAAIPNTIEIKDKITVEAKTKEIKINRKGPAPRP